MDIFKYVFFCLLALLVFLIVWGIGDSVYTSYASECTEEMHVLKGVDGMTDVNDGLLSSGDVSRTSLLFEDGLIITVGRRINNLQLGKLMVVERCEYNGEIDYRLK